MTEGEIERAAAKRRLVGSLVHHHEQECDEISLDDDQRQRPDNSVSRRDQPDQRPDNDDDAVVAGRADRPPSRIAPTIRAASPGVSGFSRIFCSAELQSCSWSHSPRMMILLMLQKGRNLGIDEGAIRRDS